VDRPGGPPGNLSSASARLDATLRHFNEVLGDPNVQSQVKLAVNNFQAVSESGVRLAADLEKFAADAREVAAQAKTLAGDAQASLDKLDANVDQVTRDVRTSLEQANGFLRELNGMMTRVNRGEGTVGKLVTDDRFYEALVLTFRRLAETVEEFKLLAKDWQQGKIRVAF
jgi:phospholipid/cholesterol/gamma-HCH transport system substrate-binding protein